MMEKMPRICDVLGVEPGEVFQYKGSEQLGRICGSYIVSKEEGWIYRVDDDGTPAPSPTDGSAICEMVNNTDGITTEHPRQRGATVEDLKAMIVELEIDLAKSKVRGWYCPYGVLDEFRDPRTEFGLGYCDNRDCGDCKDKYWAKLRKKYEDEVARL